MGRRVICFRSFSPKTRAGPAVALGWSPDRRTEDPGLASALCCEMRRHVSSASFLIRWVVCAHPLRWYLPIHSFGRRARMLEAVEAHRDAEARDGGRFPGMLVEPGKNGRVLEIEIPERIRGGKLTSERGLAGLPRPEKGNDPTPREGCTCKRHVAIAGDRSRIPHHEKLLSRGVFHGAPREYVHDVRESCVIASASVVPPSAYASGQRKGAAQSRFASPDRIASS